MSVKAINDSDFDFEVLNAQGAVFVDFWAPWCGPCRTMFPIIEHLSEKYGYKYKFYSVNVEENENLAQKFGIKNIPTFMLFEDGKEESVIIGAVSQSDIENVLR